MDLPAGVAGAAFGDGGLEGRVALAPIAGAG
jgi:hypothetical protein